VNIDDFHLWVLSAVVAAASWFLKDTRTNIKELTEKNNRLERNTRQIKDCQCEIVRKELNDFKTMIISDYTTKLDIARFEDRIENRLRELSDKHKH
jgi:predicted RNase H-like nuclease (RuvC/YqgF family)